MVSFGVERFSSPSGEWALDWALAKRKAGASHFCFEFAGTETDEALNKLGKYLHEELGPLGNDMDGEPTLCLTVILENYPSKDWLETLLISVMPDVILLKVNVKELDVLQNAVADFIRDVQYDAKGNPSKPCRPLGRGLFTTARVHLGVLGEFEGVDILQLMVDKYAKDLKVIHFGDVRPPNFRMRQVEFVNSRGINVMMNILPSTSTAEGSQYLAGYAANYERQNSLSFLTKALIQMGIVPVLARGFPDADIHGSILPILHPFTEKRKYFSANRDYTFIITVEHIEELKVRSEDIEKEADHVWHKVATTPAPARKLTYAKSGTT
jgi:hypothetical protein